MPDLNLKRRLSETDLKCLYLERLRRLGLINAKSVIASEYSLGQTGRRVDLAILSSEFIGIEFKSKGDSLKRLKPQLDAYVRCFDRVVLVADERHIANAQPLVPASVEVWSVNCEGELSLVQEALSERAQSARALAQLCSVRQLRRLASVAASSAPSRSRLIDAAMLLPFDKVYEAAVAAFKGTFERSSAAFWNELESQKEIGREALAPLSRFADVRQKKISALREQSEFWLAWAEEAATILGATSHTPITG
jgi:hypothetical protein